MGIPGNTIRSAVLGIPLNPNKEPDRAGMVRAFEQQDARAIANSAGAIIKDSYSDLVDHSNPAASLMAWVMGGVAEDGVYQNTGSPSAPNWVKLGPLPFGVIRFTNVGAGTADAIVATAWTALPDDPGMALFTMEILAANTGAVTINGKALKLGNGDPVPAAYLAPGEIMFLDHGDEYRLLYFGDPAAVQAAVQALYGSFLDLYLGAYADDAAATTAAGGSPNQGQTYWNTTSQQLRVYDGGWMAATESAATLTYSTDTGDGGASYTLDASAQFANTFLVIDTRHMPRDPTVYTLVNGALTLSENLDAGIRIDAYTFDVVPLGNTSADLVSLSNGGGDMDNAQTVQEMFDYLKVNVGGGPSSQIVRLEDYEETAGSGGDDTAAFLSACASGKPDLDIGTGGKTYRINATIDNATHGTLQRILGARRGTLKQRNSGENILLVDGIEDLSIEGVNLLGVHSSGLTDAADLNNRGIILQGAHGATLRDIYGTRTKFQVVHNIGSDGIIIEGLEGFEVGILYSCRGGIGQSLRRFKAVDSIFADSIFTIAVTLESTDGHAEGIPEEVSLDDVLVRGFYNAQGVMAHAISDGRFSNIDVDGSLIGFSLNPASAGGASDVISRCVITNVNINGPASGSSTGVGNSGFVIAGGSDSTIRQVTASNVVVRNGNRIEQLANQGAVSLWYAERVTFTGFAVDNSWGNAFLINNDVDNFVMAGYVIDSVAAVSGTQNGVRVPQTSVAGLLDGGMIRDTSVGINRVGGSGIDIGDHKYASVSTPTI